MRHLITIDDLSVKEIINILDLAEEISLSGALPQKMTGKIAANLFFQPSTRTRIGFQIAMKRLGGDSVEVNMPKYQDGMDKPESFLDTARVVSDYCDIAIVRHKDMSEIQNFCSISSVPVINAGGGIEHHPTQAVIDLFSIRKKLGSINKLRIGIAGNLKTSRAAQSLIHVLSHFSPNEVRLMAPSELMPPKDVYSIFSDGIITMRECLELEHLNILYMAGFPANSDRTNLSNREVFRLSLERLGKMPEDCVVLSPLPRIDEIDTRIDETPQAGYFKQSRDAQYVRMAILIMIADKCFNMNQLRGACNNGTT